MANLVLVDSSVWIDHFNGAVNPQVEWLRAALDNGEDDILGGDLITQEVLQGFRLDKYFSQAERALALFPCVALRWAGARTALLLPPCTAACAREASRFASL